MKYKAIIFDLFGTLIENMSVADYQVLLCDIAGMITPDQDTFIDLWLEYTEHRMTGTHSNDHSMIAVVRRMGIAPEPEMIDAALEMFNPPVERRLVASETVLNTLSALHDQGFVTGLASNCSWEVPPLWEQSPLKPKIHKPVFSCAANCRKPDTAIYRLAASNAGVEPEECIFVDDSIDALNGALNAGLTPVHIQDAELKSYHNDGRIWDGHTINSFPDILDLTDRLNS